MNKIYTAEELQDIFTEEVMPELERHFSKTTYESSELDSLFKKLETILLYYISDTDEETPFMTRYLNTRSEIIRNLEHSCLEGNEEQFNKEIRHIPYFIENSITQAKRLTLP